jgi:hypothetical protein
LKSHWANYFTNVNGSLASIRLDLGWYIELPIPSKQWLAYVWVDFRSPRPDGLSDSGEAPTLYVIEDMLTAEFDRAFEATFVGCITTLGRREFYFYGERKRDLALIVQSVANRFPGYRFTEGEDHDPEWNHYTAVLYPNDRQMETISNADTLDVMKAEGDVHEIPRMVEHWSYFASKTDRDKFREAASRAAFAVEEENEVEGPLPFSIRVSAIQPIDYNAINATSLQLYDLALEWNGEYTGWEAQVTTE